VSLEQLGADQRTRFAELGIFVDLQVWASSSPARTGCSHGALVPRRPTFTPPGAELRRFEGHGDRVTSVTVLADGRRALSGSRDRTLTLWDL
jgi:WD40 repeat protein